MSSDTFSSSDTYSSATDYSESDADNSDSCSTSSSESSYSSQTTSTSSGSSDSVGGNTIEDADSGSERQFTGGPRIDPTLNRPLYKGCRLTVLESSVLMLQLFLRSVVF